MNEPSATAGDAREETSPHRAGDGKEKRRESPASKARPAKVGGTLAERPGKKRRKVNHGMAVPLPSSPFSSCLNRCLSSPVLPLSSLLAEPQPYTPPSSLSPYGPGAWFAFNEKRGCFVLLHDTRPSCLVFTLSFPAYPLIDRPKPY
jgi:hypothetical protein